MAIGAMYLPEFEVEMAGTRKTLERVPDDKFDWRAHKKSYSLGEIATHLANLPTWAGITLNQDSFDVSPPDGSSTKIEQAKSTKEVLANFDKNVADAKAAIAAASDEVFMQNWTLLAGGQELFTMPKTAVLRSFVLNHMIHHRAQLGVYLRLNDIPVPAIYGPSADEEGM